MSKFRFELNSDGVRELLKSPGVQVELIRHANQIQALAGDDYEVFYTSQRVGIRAANERGERDNLENNTLLKAGGSR